MKIGEPRVCNQNVEDLVNTIFDRRVDSKSFIDFVTQQWQNRRFVLKCIDITSLITKIIACTEDQIDSFHGRKNQPVSTSRHLFGSCNTISARLVFDPPAGQTTYDEIEFHSHPVSSILIVTQGSGEFYLQYSESRQSHIVQILLSPGVVVFFPASVVHTMKPGNEGIQTLNVTNRQNQPPYREGNWLDRGVQNSLPISDPDYSTYADIPEDVEHLDYRSFLELENKNEKTGSE